MNSKILTHLALALSLIITGCATTNPTQTTDNTKTIIKKPIETKNISKREELANLFLDSFATKEFLQSAIDSNPNESKELLTCIGSDSTLIEANKKVKAIFLENIEGLSDDEVNQYISYLKNGGASALKKLYINNYQNATKKHQKKEINLEDNAIKLLASFTEEESKAYNSFDTLPNEDVRKLVFPRDTAQDEMFRVLLYNLPARWAIQDNCKKYIKQKPKS